MLVFALVFRDRLVGDPFHDVLEERVLSALRRTRIGLYRDNLLAQKTGEERVEFLLRDTAHRCETLLRERLAEHRAALD